MIKDINYRALIVFPNVGMDLLLVQNNVMTKTLGDVIQIALELIRSILVFEEILLAHHYVLSILKLQQIKLHTIHQLHLYKH